MYCSKRFSIVKSIWPRGIGDCCLKSNRVIGSQRVCETIDRIVKQRGVKSEEIRSIVGLLAWRLESRLIALLRVGGIRYEITDRSPTNVSPTPPLDLQPFCSLFRRISTWLHRHTSSALPPVDQTILGSESVTTQFQLIGSSIEKKKKKKKWNKRSRFQTFASSMPIKDKGVHRGKLFLSLSLLLAS